MGDLFSLLQDLSERIFCPKENSDSSQHDEEDPIEARLRAVLPNLIDKYLIPSGVKEKEMVAVLKLLLRIVKIYPRMFCDKTGSAVVPIIARIFPLLAEPTLRSQFSNIFEALAALFLLIRSGDRDTYNCLVGDLSNLIEELASVASFFTVPSAFSTSVAIQALPNACAVAFSDVPTSMGPSSQEQQTGGFPFPWVNEIRSGVLIDVTGRARWQPLAEWTIKLLAQCLAKDKFHGAGLIMPGTMAVIGTLLSYGDASLHEACFHTLSVSVSAVDTDSIPFEDLILSLVTILSSPTAFGALPSYRTEAYDSALAVCLQSLFMAAPVSAVKYTLQHFLNIFSSTMHMTCSEGLQVALCSILVHMMEKLPDASRHLALLLPFLGYAALTQPLISMISTVANTMAILYASENLVLVEQPPEVPVSLDQEAPLTRHRRRRSAASGSLHRRQKKFRAVKSSERGASLAATPIEGALKEEAMMIWEHESTSALTAVGGPPPVYQANPLGSALLDSIVRAIQEAGPSKVATDRLELVEGKLTSLRALAGGFSNVHGSRCWRLIASSLETWILWASLQLGSTLPPKIVTLLVQAVEYFLLGRDFYQELGRQPRIESPWSPDATAKLLLLPWAPCYDSDNTAGVRESLSSAKIKSLTLALYFIEFLAEDTLWELIDRATQDSQPNVRVAGVFHLPSFAARFKAQKIIECGERLRSLLGDSSEAVLEQVGLSIGPLVCLSLLPPFTLECQDIGGAMEQPSSKRTKFAARPDDLIPNKNSKKGCQLCCNIGIPTTKDSSSQNLTQLSCKSWQPFFVPLLFQQGSARVQVAFIHSFPYLLGHCSEGDLAYSRDDWLMCLENLPLHPHKPIRSAFNSVIGSFVNKLVLEGLFKNEGGEGENSTSSRVVSNEMARALAMLSKLRQHLGGTRDTEILSSLMEAIANVAVSAAASDLKPLVFFCIVLLMEQLDSPDLSTRVTAAHLIKSISKACYEASPQAGNLGAMVAAHKEQLYEYLSTRQVARPALVREFAEGVLEVEAGGLVREMMPVVLPRLVLEAATSDVAVTAGERQKKSQALVVLKELASRQGVQLATLLVEWCHKVLAALLLGANGEDIDAVLKFYEIQTEGEIQELLRAVEPNLLEELVRHIGADGRAAASRRATRVGPMIQEIARAVGSSSDDVADFLRLRFVGLLNSLDRNLLRSSSTQQQQQALCCLDRLIDMIGNHLSAFVPKILALLNRAMQERHLLVEALATWQSFVCALARVSPAALKGVASQIVVAIMPCLGPPPSATAGIGVDGGESEAGGEARLAAEGEDCLPLAVKVLAELIVQNEGLLEEQAQELPLLPSLPELESVNEVLQRARGELALEQQLQRAAEGLAHESLSVRHVAAGELRRLLRSRRLEVVAMVVGESAAPQELASRLVALLLQGCAEESRTVDGNRVKLACAECLGELGAVDPARLHVAMPPRGHISLSDDDLVAELVGGHLAKVLRAAAEADAQDAAALAIQELLKLCGCSESLLEACPQALVEEPSDGSKHRKVRRSKVAGEVSKAGSNLPSTTVERGEKLWAQFPEEVREIIAPCLTSKFSLKPSGATLGSGPVFRRHLSFRRWMCLWCRRLIAQSTGCRAEIFRACQGIVRHHMGVALFLLPHLVLNVVCEGEDDAATAGVAEEILAVLAEDVATAVPLPPSRDADINLRPSEVSTQTVFSLLDSLGVWYEGARQTLLRLPGGKNSSLRSVDVATEDAAAKLDGRCRRFEALLSAIPRQALAKASFRCQANARALMYLEGHVRDTSGTLNAAAECSRGPFADADVSFLLEIYSGLSEPDGFAGISRLRAMPSLQDQVLILEAAGNWAEALACYEQALALDPASATQHAGLLRCLLHMGHLQAMAAHVDGQLTRLPQHAGLWGTFGAQAAWRLGQWSRLEEYLEVAGGNSELPGWPIGSDGGMFHLGVARVMHGLQCRDASAFYENLQRTRQALLPTLAAAGMESYTRAYPLVVKLHILQELEDGFSCTDTWQQPLARTLSDTDDARAVHHPGSDPSWGWGERLKATQPSMWTREPILAVRRQMYSLRGLRAEVGACWLQYAKMCRQAGYNQTANRAVLEARAYEAPGVHLESAKLQWAMGHCHRAVAELQEFLCQVATVPAQLGAAPAKLPPAPSTGSGSHSTGQGGSAGTPSVDLAGGSGGQQEHSEELARTMLMLARWVHHTGQEQKTEVIGLFHKVKALQPRWEKSYFFLAKYYDDLLIDARRRQEDPPLDIGPLPTVISRGKGGKVAGSDKAWWSYVPEAMSNYAKGLHKGHKRLFQSLPRLLTLWFEFGARFHGEALQKNLSLQNEQKKVTAIMKACLRDLPTYQWLSAMPQLVSRICHSNPDVLQPLKDILCRVLRSHPQQALWAMAAVSKSTLAARREAAADIINRARNEARTEAERVVFLQFAAFVEQMIRLCFHQGGTGGAQGQARAKTLSISSEFSSLKRMMPVGVVVPVQGGLAGAFPADGLTNPTYDPFPAGECVTIAGIVEEVEVLASLQRPKKVVLLGSDGREHPFLCKPKDDLRKDARMMEFVGMLNRLLAKDAASRRRQLYIRTFAVIPLTEDCGMIEWVPHTRGLRHIMQDLYTAAGKFDRVRTNGTIKKIYDAHQGQGREGEMLRTLVLPLFPPLFHRWLLHEFPEPAAWFTARTAYARTTAVWSMVGHIVGLGDRHGENILYDATTGDCVHVDFSCLFDKGLFLEKPELVPFRLTQNLVDGLGITGYEGVFRKVCQISLGVLRSHRETLMSVLETFIHDPLVEWTKSHKSSGVEVQNPHAKRALASIQARLQGVVVGVGAAPSLPLSVEGQAHRLILEAVSHDNLGKMYIWWMSWF